MIEKNKEDKIDHDYNELNDVEKDILMELGNIGSGHAVTALSEILGSFVEITLTSVKLVPFWKFADLFVNPQEILFGIISKIKEKEKLTILQIFSLNSLYSLLQINSKDNKIKNVEKIKTIGDISSENLEKLREIGNILAGHYASALANLMGTILIPEVPRVALDNIQAMSNSLIANYAEISNYSIIIDTKLIIRESDIKGLFCFVPDFKSINKIIQNLKIKQNLGQ